MKQTILLILVGLCASIGAFGESKSPTSAPPPLIPSEPIWVFGFIPQDAWVSHHYILTNPHEDTVTILSMDGACDCTHVPKGPVKVPPGGRYLMKTLFDTRTYYGETNRSVHIVTDHQPNPEMDVYFASIASVKPNTIAMVPPSVAFIRGIDQQTVQIQNLSSKETRFTIYADHDSILTLSETQFILPAKGTRDINVTIDWSKVPKGDSYSCLVVEYLREEGNRASIPIKINKF
jgi:hypothetical protein